MLENLDESVLRSNNRRKYYDIWQKYKADEVLEGEEKVIVELMALHKDWYDYWDSTDFDCEFDPMNEFNPYVHIIFDTIVMNQINANNSPQTKFTYNKLTARGDSHLEAIHKIAYVFLREFWDVMKYHKEFNEKRYSRKLKDLK